MATETGPGVAVGYLKLCVEIGLNSVSVLVANLFVERDLNCG